MLATVFAAMVVCAGCTLDPATPSPHRRRTDAHQWAESGGYQSTGHDLIDVTRQRERSAHLSTVDRSPETITADRKLRQVKFTVKDRAAFNLDAVKQAVGDRYADGMKLLTEPTDK